jgi:hypothetical protein
MLHIIGIVLIGFLVGQPAEFMGSVVSAVAPLALMQLFGH